MKKHLFIALIMFGVSIGNAQVNLDSLYSVWQDTAKPDSIRMEAVDNYIWYGLLYTNPNEAIVMADSLLNFAQTRNAKKNMATALSLKGVAFWVKSDFDKAIEFHQKSLKLKQELGDELGVASSLTNLGINYGAIGDYNKALDFYLKALETNIRLKDKNKIANSYYNIAIIHSRKGDFISALNYQRKVLKISEEFEDTRGIILSLSSIGDIYALQENFKDAINYYVQALTIIKESGNNERLAMITSNLGQMYIGLEDYSKALTQISTALKLDEEKGNVRGVVANLASLGLIYKELNDTERAIEFLKRSVIESKEVSDTHTTSLSLFHLGEIYISKGYNRQAILSCEEGYQLAKKIGILKEQELLCNCLYRAYKNLGQDQKALEYHEKMLQLDDSLQTEETAKKLQKMEFENQQLADSLLQVEKDLKVEMAHQKEVREKDRNKNIALGAGVFLLFLSGGLYGRWRYVKKSKAIIEEEKQRSDTLLLNILPSEIAEELKTKGSADARDFDLVSILFTDFKGFTEASEKLSAQELIAEINTCFKAFDHICETYGIEKIKTIGDAYMAAGGLPVPSNDSVKQTVMAALDMQEFIVNRLSEKEHSNDVAFKMRVGIHTGPVVAGIVGVKKFQYDIWGDTVNTASRMESSGAIGKVNISEDTYELIKHDPQFVFEPRGKIKAKGKGEINMYFVSKA